MDIHYDSLVDEDPEVQERVAKGKVEMAQKMVADLVEARFPALSELAQERVTLIRDTGGFKPTNKTSWYSSRRSYCTLAVEYICGLI